MCPSGSDSLHEHAIDALGAPTPSTPTPPAISDVRRNRRLHVLIAALAVWLIASPFALGYRDSTLLPGSDVACGVLLLVLCLPAARFSRTLASALTAAVGVWLMFAPLAARTASAAAYANDTLIGALLIAFGFVLPTRTHRPGSQIPEGWTYNPSSWPQRAPVVALSLLAVVVTHYMASYQLGHMSSVWDPFGPGTELVLRSRVSRMVPVSDAGLGSLAYVLELLMALKGDEQRWRTMPWMVTGFGLIVVPLGIVSIVLVILQPLLVGAWCSLCLFTAAAMLLMIPLSLDEVVAVLQGLRRAHERGTSVWRSFWFGMQAEVQPMNALPARPVTWKLRGMLWGMTGSLPLLLSAAAGIWLMAGAPLLGVASDAEVAYSDELVGALIVVVSVISVAEVARPIRFLNAALGGWVLLTPWLLTGATAAFAWNSVLVGSGLILLSLPRGRIRDRYGRFDTAIDWRPLRRGHAVHE
jgi:hypothetical protein